MAAHAKSREDDDSAERESGEAGIGNQEDNARGELGSMVEKFRFDPNILLNWDASFQRGEDSMNVTMPICQGSVRTAIETDYLHDPIWLQSDRKYNVSGDNVSIEDMCTVRPDPGGKKPRGPVTAGAPVSNAIAAPVPDSCIATSDEGAESRGKDFKDMLDDPEKVIERFLKAFRVNWQVKGKHNPGTGEFEVHGYVVPGEEGESPIVITPHATSSVEKTAERPGQVVVSLARGEKLIQGGEDAPVLTEIANRPLATQLASGAGNIADSNYTSNGDVKLNGLFNAIGFLTQLALGAKLTFIINLGAGAGAETGST